MLSARSTWGPYCSIFFCLAQSLLQGYFHSIDFATASTLSQNLEQKVEEQTRILDNKNQELQEQIEETKGLVKVISHDIANPLAVISGAAELLQARIPKDEERNHRLIEKIIRSSNTQNDILDHIKHLQAMKDGKEELQLSPLNIRDAMEEVCFAFEERLNQKELKFNIQYPEGEGILALAEKVSLVNEVLNNIVSNAIKFSPHGGVIHVLVEKRMNGY